MKIKVNKREIKDAVEKAFAVLQSKPLNQILETLKISNVEGSLQITGSDGDIQVMSMVKAELAAFPDFCINGGKFRNAIVSLTEEDENGLIEIAIEEKKIIVKSGKIRHTINSFPAKDFPSPSSLSEDSETVNCNQDIASAMFKVLPTASRDITRMYLNGVRVESDMVAATDYFRLAIINIQTGLKRGITIPNRLVSLLRHFKGLFTLTTDGSVISIEDDTTIIRGYLVREEYPIIRSALKREWEYVLKFSKSAFMEITKALDVSTSRTNFFRTRIQLSEDKINIFAQDENGMETEVEIPATFSVKEGYTAWIQPWERQANIRYFQSLVSIFDRDDLELQISANLKSPVFADMDNIQYAAMPVLEAK